MGITKIANVALRASDIDRTAAELARLGARVGPIEEWEGRRRVDLVLGGTDVTLFTKAIYESDDEPLPDGFLHFACFSDDLERDLAEHEVFFGPVVVSGRFGTRRIAFTRVGGTTIELMEQMAEP